MAAPPDTVQTAPTPRADASTRNVAIAAATLLLLLLVWFLFFRGGGDEQVEAVAPPPAPVVNPIEDEEVAEAPGKRDPVETFEVFAPKDPFDPLVSASAVAGGGAEAAGTTNTTTGGTSTVADPGTGTDGGSTTGTGTTTATTNTGGDARGEDVNGHRVRVVDVFRDEGRDRAQVQVDGTVYTVDEGERFAQNFQLMSTSGQCATMLFGDDEFTLCEGEEILK